MLLCAIFLATCNSPKEYEPKNINSDDRPFVIETMQKIITAFDEEDHAALLELFSDTAKENYDLEAQIEEAMRYYKGQSIEKCSDVTYFFTNSSKIKDNKYYYKSIEFMLFNMETDVGASYSFDVFYTRVDEENPSQLGIAKLYFKDPTSNNGYVLAIGDLLE